MTTDQAVADVRSAAKAAGIETHWIEIVNERSYRYDAMLGETDVVQWTVRMEIRGDNGFGHRRFRFIRETAPMLRQAVERATAAMVTPTHQKV